MNHFYDVSGTLERQSRSGGMLSQSTYDTREALRCPRDSAVCDIYTTVRDWAMEECRMATNGASFSCLC